MSKRNRALSSPSSSDKLFECQHCSDKFAKNQDLVLHVRRYHERLRYRCPRCDNMCKVFTEERYLSNHFKRRHGNDESMNCMHCNKDFSTRNQLLGYEHMQSCCTVRVTSQEGGAVAEGGANANVGPASPAVRLEEDNLHEVDVAMTSDLPEDVADEVGYHWHQIHTHHDTLDILDHRYNFRWTGEHDFFQRTLTTIYSNERETFRMNAAIGVMLRHRETDELHYFHASQNNFNIFERPRLINDDASLHNVIAEISEMDLTTKFSTPSTKWVLVLLCNVEFYVTPMKKLVAGCAKGEMSANLQSAVAGKHLVPMLWRPDRNRYNDNLCFFRCLARCLYSPTFSEQQVKELFAKYCQCKTQQYTTDTFPGLPYTDIDVAEKLYKVDIQLYHMTDEGDAECWRHHARHYDKVLNLDVSRVSSQQLHYSFINSLKGYSRRYICVDCERVFNSLPNYNQHHRKHHCHCGKTEHVFPGRRQSVYRPKLSLMQQLDEAGVVGPENLRRCPYVAVFDFESMLIKCKPTNTNETDKPVTKKSKKNKGSKEKFISRHQPVSCAAKSNVPECEETFYKCDQSPDRLVSQLLQWLTHVAQNQYEIQSRKYADTFEALQAKVDEVTAVVTALKGENRDCKREKGYLNRLKRLINSLDEYCRQLTVVGFNSKKYDINLIKRHLFPALVSQVRRRRKDPTSEEGKDEIEDNECDEIDDDGSEQDENFVADDQINGDNNYTQPNLEQEEEQGDEEECEETTDNDEKFYDKDGGINIEKRKKVRKWPRAIIHNGAMVCMTTDNLRFLDVSNYLAAGSSLDKFMRMYEPLEHKAKFPYDYLDSFERLSETKLPSRESFNNEMRKTEISDDDYAQCLRYWVDGGMRTFGDYLEMYNKRDVEPFLKSALKMANEFWDKFHIDIYREVISLPGLTERYLGHEVRTPFALFSKTHKQYHYELKESMTGGLSVVMNRMAIKGETRIRDPVNGPLVASICGLDANAFYLYSQGQPMPSGFASIWMYDTEHDCYNKKGTKPESMDWFEMLEWTQDIKIRHLGNDREWRVGPRQLHVDGYCAETHTVYQYYGCYYHRCRRCPAGQKLKEKDDDKEHEGRMETEQYIRDMGYKLVTMWGCDWMPQRMHYIQQCQLANDPTFVQRRFAHTPRASRKLFTRELLAGNVFGFAKIDIFTPQHLEDQFADFPPIIKMALIKETDIGEHIQEYAKMYGEMKTPRRNLISSYKGEGVILMTPMIKFLVEHGLELRHIHYVLEYDPVSCYTDFMDTVTSNRLGGDGYVCTKVQETGQWAAQLAAEGEFSQASVLAAETYKLLGNTGYGKTLTNKERHIDVFYCDYEQAVRESFSPYIKRIKYVDKDCYEVHKFKEKITMDLPIIIGLAVYQWSKLRMLEFAYDLLGRFMDPSNYMWMESDTDSAYLALAKENLDDCVRPELRDEYDKIKHLWFVDDKRAYSKRQPGLFKIEFRGSSMICLCSKTYISFDELTKKTKISSKGLQALNQFTLEDYRAVLDDMKSSGGENVGFRMRADGFIWTYSQLRLGLSYLYIKRIVQTDGVSTKPLTI